MEGGKRIGKGTLLLLADIAVELGFVRAGGCIGFKAGLPLGELHGVGIDGFDLLRERLERTAVLRLCFGGLAFVGVLDDVRLLHTVTDAIDDLVATVECAVDVGNGGCGIDFCHDILCYGLFRVVGGRSYARLTPCAGDEDCCWLYEPREQSLTEGGFYAFRGR